MIFFEFFRRLKEEEEEEDDDRSSEQKALTLNDKSTTREVKCVVGRASMRISIIHRSLRLLPTPVNDIEWPLYIIS